MFLNVYRQPPHARPRREWVFVAEFPDWAFRQCYQQAARIMDNAQTSYYEAAVEWLRQGRDILLQAGQSARWQDVLTELLQKHKRKYKLRPMLESLRVR